MDTFILLPNFIDFFSEAKNHSTSPGNLAVIFLTFGNIPPVRSFSGPHIGSASAFIIYLFLTYCVLCRSA